MDLLVVWLLELCKCHILSNLLVGPFANCSSVRLEASTLSWWFHRSSFVLYQVCSLCSTNCSFLGGEMLLSNCFKPDRCENPFSVNYQLQRLCSPKACHQFKYFNGNIYSLCSWRASEKESCCHSWTEQAFQARQVTDFLCPLGGIDFVALSAVSCDCKWHIVTWYLFKDARHNSSACYLFPTTNRACN